MAAVHACTVTRIVDARPHCRAAALAHMQLTHTSCWRREAICASISRSCSISASRLGIGTGVGLGGAGASRSTGAAATVSPAPVVSVAASVGSTCKQAPTHEKHGSRSAPSPGTRRIAHIGRVSSLLPPRHPPGQASSTQPYELGSLLRQHRCPPCLARCAGVLLGRPGVREAECLNLVVCVGTGRPCAKVSLELAEPLALVHGCARSWTRAALTRRSCTCDSRTRGLQEHSYVPINTRSHGCHARAGSRSQGQARGLVRPRTGGRMPHLDRSRDAVRARPDGRARARALLLAS